jgi:hypothetical protein
MVGGGVWLVFGLIEASAGPVVAAQPFPLLLTIIAELLGAVGLVGLHALQQGSYGDLGKGGFYTTLAGIVAQVLGSVIALFGSAALTWLVFPVGFLLIFAGLVLYGGATLEAGVLPRWYGIVLIITMPIDFLLQQYGGIWIGLVFLVLGYVLWLGRGTVRASRGRPSRVR